MVQLIIHLGTVMPSFILFWNIVYAKLEKINSEMPRLAYFSSFAILCKSVPKVYSKELNLK